MKRLVGVKTPTYVLFDEYFIETKFSSVSLTRNCFGTPKQKYILHKNRRLKCPQNCGRKTIESSKYTTLKRKCTVGGAINKNSMTLKHDMMQSEFIE
jgi:hypothetical protein